MAKRLEETDPINFGKYKGTPLKDVPVYYLLWCYHNGYVTPEVHRYVKANYIEFQKQEDEKNRKKDF